MYLCFDDRLVLHWARGRHAICGNRDLMEVAHPESFVGNEIRCRICEKLKKKEGKRASGTLEDAA